MLIGSAMSLEGSRPVLVEDLGPTGARVVGRHLPEAGKQMILRTPEHAILGRVAWADQDERGVMFEEPLAERQG